MGVYTDEDLDDLVRENLCLAKENNVLLRKIRRAEVLGLWFRVLFFLVVIGVPIFVYKYYLEEYVRDLGASFSAMQEDASVLRDFPDKIPGAEKIKSFFPSKEESVE